MKPFILSILLSVVAVTGFAQSDKFTAAMQKNLALLDSAKTAQDLTAVSNAFERVGDAEKTQWLPYYYAALAQTNIGWMSPNTEKDQVAEKANALIAKAEAIEKNAEIYTLKNMSATIQMMVDPMSRWQTYGAQAGTALQQAIKLDPNNPRPYYLQGMSIFNTPEQFGGGKAKAKAIFEKAVELYKAEKPKPLYPHWGQKEAESMLAKCS